MTKNLKLASAMALAASGSKRGIFGVKAESVNAEEMMKVISGLNTAFEEFKGAQAERDSNIEKKFDDVVTRDKIAKIDAQIEDMMSAVDQANTTLAALQAHGSDGPDNVLSPEMRDYAKAFKAWAKTGEGEGEIQAANRRGGVMADMSVGSDPDGGYTAPVEWDRMITDKLQEITPMRRYAAVQRVSGQGFRHLFNLHGASSGWVGETDPRPKTGTPTFLPYDFSFGEIYANPAITQQVAEDSEIDIVSWLAGEVDMEFSIREGEAFLSGDGVDKPKGILMYDAAAEAALPANKRHPLGPIPETNTGEAAGLSPDGLVDLIYDTPAERITSGSAFYMNRKTHSVVRKMKDGQGTYLWQPPFQLGQPAMLLGYGVRDMNGMPDVAANAIPVMFGDMGQTYRIFDRVGVQILRDPYTNKPYIHFYTRKRVGGGLWNPEYMRYHRVAA